MSKIQNSTDEVWGVACPDIHEDGSRCPGIMVAQRSDGADFLLLFYDRDDALAEAQRHGFSKIKKVKVFVSEFDETYEEVN